MLSVSIRHAENLPCPMLFLHDAEALGAWHASILTEAYDRGERDLTLCCFPTLSACSVEEGCAAIFAAVQTFLSCHEDVTALTLLCEGEDISSALAALCP